MAMPCLSLLQPSTWDTYSSAVTQTSNGTWYLHARVTDTAGNTATKYFGPYRIDKTAPSGVFTPSSCDWNKNIQVIFTPSDSGGSQMQHWRYALSSDNGSTWDSWGSYITGNTTGTINISTSGEWKIKTELTDNAGNTATVYSGTYKIDNIAPTISAQPPNRDWDDKPATVTLNFSDSGGSGLAIKQYAWIVDTVVPETWENYTVPVTQSMAGKWYLYAKAIDNAGNIAIECFGPYIVDGLKHIAVTPCFDILSANDFLFTPDSENRLSKSDLPSTGLL
jgi:hypothetical protein